MRERIKNVENRVSEMEKKLQEAEQVKPRLEHENAEQKLELLSLRYDEPSM